MIMLTVLNYDALNRNPSASFSSSSKKGNSYSTYYRHGGDDEGLIMIHESVNKYFCQRIKFVLDYANICSLCNYSAKLEQESLDWFW